MNDSDNSGKSNHQNNKSPVRRGLIIGAITGASLTIGIQLLFEVVAIGGESTAVWVLLGPWAANQAITCTICQFFGVAWKIGGGPHIPLTNLCLMVAVNSVFCSVIGGVIGFLVRRRK